MNTLKKPTFRLWMILAVLVPLISLLGCRSHTANEEHPDYKAFDRDKQDMLNHIDDRIANADQDIQQIRERIQEHEASMEPEVKSQFRSLIDDYREYQDRLRDKKDEVQNAPEGQFEDYKTGFNTWWANIDLELKELKVKTKDVFTRDYSVDSTGTVTGSDTAR